MLAKHEGKKITKVDFIKIYSRFNGRSAKKHIDL